VMGLKDTIQQTGKTTTLSYYLVGNVNRSWSSSIAGVHQRTLPGILDRTIHCFRHHIYKYCRVVLGCSFSFPLPMNSQWITCWSMLIRCSDNIRFSTNKYSKFHCHMTSVRPTRKHPQTQIEFCSHLSRLFLLM